MRRHARPEGRVGAIVQPELAARLLDQRREGRVVWHADVFVEDRDLPLRWDQRGQGQQAQWLPDPVAVPPTTFEVGKAYKWVAGVDQI